MSEAKAVAEHIAARVTDADPAPSGQLTGPVELVYGANCREGAERPASANQAQVGAVPHECVFIIPTGGYPDRPEKGGDRDADPSLWPGDKFPTFDCIVRGPVKNWERAEALAAVVQRSIDKSIVAGYFETRAPMPPFWLREDDENRHIFKFAIELRSSQ